MGDLAVSKHLADNSSVPTLANLITNRKRDRGLSYAELAAKTDYVVTRQRFQQLATSVRMKEFPEPATLAAIAAALEVDVALVVLATAESIGLSVDMGMSSELALMLPASAKRLTIDQRNALLALVRSIVAVDPVAGNEPEDSRGVASTWLPPEDSGMSGDQDSDDGDQLSSG